MLRPYAVFCLAPLLRRSYYYVRHLSILICGLVPGRATHSVGDPIDHRLRHRASRGARLLLRLRRGHGGADDDSRCKSHCGSRRSGAAIIAAITVTVGATAAIVGVPAAIVVIPGIVLPARLRVLPVGLATVLIAGSRRLAIFLIAGTRRLAIVLIAGSRRLS